MGNEGVYSVGKEWEKTHFKKQYEVSVVDHSRLGLSLESLTKSSMLRTSQFPACASHVACFAA